MFSNDWESVFDWLTLGEKLGGGHEYAHQRYSHSDEDHLALARQLLYERTNDMPGRWLEFLTSDLQAREACA